MIAYHFLCSVIVNHNLQKMRKLYYLVNFAFSDAHSITAHLRVASFGSTDRLVTFRSKPNNLATLQWVQSVL